MGAWDSLDDLWWLKPKPQLVHAINGMALGAQLAQRSFDNKMEVEKMAMDVESQAIQRAIAEQSAKRARTEFLLDSASFEALSEYQNRLNLTPTDKEPPLPPAMLTPRFAAQAHTALSDWKGQANYIMRHKTALEAMETVSKYENGLLDDARKLLSQGGKNVIKMGPKGPMVDPDELGKASEEFRVKQLTAATMAIPTVAGMSPDIIRYRLGNGSFVTLRRNAPGLTKEEFAAKNLPDLMKQTQDVPSAAQALEELWKEYVKFTGVPSAAQPAPVAAPSKTDFKFHKGAIIPVK